MKRLNGFIKGRYPWALAAGLLLACAFPNIGIAGLAWIAPALILFAAMGQSPKQVFRLGFTAGLAHRLVSLSWLLLIPVAWAPILGWVALSAYCALFTATWAWLCWRFFPVRLNSDGDPKPNLSNVAEKFLAAPWAQRVQWTISCAALWVGLEMTISRLFSGFPWNLLGASQYRLVPLIQISSVTGIYGVSFLVVWSSLCLLCAAMVIIRRPAMRSAWVGEIILPMTAVLVIYGSGYQKLLRHESPRPHVTAALIQPSVPQNLIWNAAENTNRFRQLLELSQKAMANKPDVMIWPEAGVPEMPRYHPDVSGAISDFARTNKIWLIICADDAKPHTNAVSLADSDFYNSSFLIDPNGDFISQYKKRNLVIFGEYIPLIHWLPFLKYLTPIEDGYTPGDQPVPYTLTDLKLKVSVLICFEDVFPHLVGEYVSDDTDFLVNLTNNGWFGEGGAQWQHAASAIFRAVEQGLPLVRCCNNGLTCWIDSRGRVRNVFTNQEHGIYGPGYLMANLPVLEPGEHRVPTFYHQHGDLFGWACVTLSLLRIGQLVIAGRKTIPVVQKD